MPYRVTSLDCAAEGMERLRSQSEFILLAYASGAEVTSAAILRELSEDLQACARIDGFDYGAARVAIDEWAAEGGRARIEAELAEARNAAERGDINWNDESADEFDSVTFRLYVEATAAEPMEEPESFLAIDGRRGEDGEARVHLSESAVRDFAASWPCFGEARPLAFNFASNGDLIEVEGEDGGEYALDGAGLAALAQDAKRAAIGWLGRAWPMT